MFRNRKHITFYFTDKHLQIREIKWFRMKVGAFIAGTVLVCLSIVLIANYIFNNFLELGNSRYKTVVQENKILQDQLSIMTKRMSELETSVMKLSSQENEIRLRADLEPLDEDTKNAGTGGALVDAAFDFDSDNTSLVLQSAQKVVSRLSSEVKVQEESYQQVVKKMEFNKGYFAAMPAIKPMPGYYSRKEFGLRLHPVLGIMKTHEGLDIVNDVGTPVVATGDGTIQMAGHSGGGFGYVVVINHGYGFQSVYAHLSKIYAHEGQHVKRGDLIARSGRSGLVSGPHLHYEVRRNGVCQNPMDFFFDDVSVDDYGKQIASK